MKGDHIFINVFLFFFYLLTLVKVRAMREIRKNASKTFVNQLLNEYFGNSIRLFIYQDLK